MHCAEGYILDCARICSNFAVGLSVHASTFVLHRNISTLGSIMEGSVMK